MVWWATLGHDTGEPNNVTLVGRAGLNDVCDGALGGDSVPAGAGCEPERSVREAYAI